MRVRIAGAIGQKLGRRMVARFGNEPLFLNLGSGPRGLKSQRWLNVDGFLDKNVDYRIDFTRPLPFGPNTFDGVFCEHVIEHFDLEQGRSILAECHRVLRPGGVVRLVTPDAETILRAYLSEPEILIARRPAETGCAMESVNSYFRQRYEHQCLYDFDLMATVLRSVGFGSVERCSFRHGAVPDMLIDDAKYEWESLYCEAAKPSSGRGGIDVV